MGQLVSYDFPWLQGFEGIKEFSTYQGSSTHAFYYDQLYQLCTEYCLKECVVPFVGGISLEEGKAEAVCKVLSSHFGFTKVIINDTSNLAGPEKKLEAHIFFGPDGLVCVFKNSVNYIFIDKDLGKTFYDWVFELQKDCRKVKVDLSILKRDGHRLTTSTVSFDPRPFIPSNYSKPVADSLMTLRERVASKEVFGRLHILAGIPGTGKTSFIYSLLDLKKKAKFLLLPSVYVEKLQGDELLGILLESREKDKPVVLIIEDADQALEARSGSNQGAVSSLLNTVDGILSDHLDLRVLATTNLHLDKLDDALQRPGRLGSLITIPALSKEETKLALSKLTPDWEKYSLNKREYTLAEVYALLKEDKQAIIIEKTFSKVGF
jgi:hypothetical protein